MPSRLRKIRKTRGSRTQGYGRIGQHRKKGSKGHRRPGRHKHMWSYIIRYEPDYFGKSRFKSPRGQKEDSVINLKELEEIAVKLSPKKRTKEAKKAKVLVNLMEMGYDKLLGEGKITIPVSVKVAKCSETALKKIEALGGEIVKAETNPQVSQ